MASTVKHLRSSTANKRPTASGLADGQLAINTASGTPGLFLKDNAGAVVKVGPVHVGAAAPNATPAGSSGNSKGELWVNDTTTIHGLNYYTGSAFVNLTPSGTATTAGLVELATNAETQAGTDTIRAVTPSGLQSKVSDSTSTTSSTTIASSTAVKAAFDLANAALPKSGGRVTGNLEIGPTGSLSFEGSTDDSFETFLAVVDPTADRTITFPNVTGTVITTGDTGTVTSAMITDGTIVNADINASAGIVDTKLATISTAGKVSNSATTAVSTNTVNAIVTRDGSGNFSAGTITANLTGTASAIADNTVTSAKIVDGAIVNVDVNASAAIAGTKISPDFGSQNIVTTGTASAANILYNRRPALHRGPLFYKTAATAISIVAGSVLNGKLYSSATAVTMPSHTNNTDYAIWQNPTTGALVGDASFTTAPAGATGGSVVGGYHYIPSGRPTAVNNGSPTSAAEILEFSIWDLTWRPECPDPRGMACIDGRFWCDLYLCGSTSYAGTDFSAVPSSKIGLTIADNNAPPRIPGFYGGNGSTAYSLDGDLQPGSWINFAEVAHSFGKRFLDWSEFSAAAFGAPEAGSRGTDPGTVIWERQSKWGLAQATGTLWSWGAGTEGNRLTTTTTYSTHTGGRGSLLAGPDGPRAVRLGGNWDVGADSGSRSANWNANPWNGGSGISARFAAGHLVSC
jgi:hypothetical protein